jgi:hypothetical protein
MHALTKYSNSSVVLTQCRLGIIGVAAKSQYAPVRCSDEQVAEVCNIFPCPVVEFLIKYLGVPLSVSRLPRSALQPIADRLADKLPTWMEGLHDASQRKACVREDNVIGHADVHVHRSWLTKACEKIMRAFLWWALVLFKVASALSPGPRCNTGGLGLLDLKVFGRALRIRWPWFLRRPVFFSAAQLGFGRRPFFSFWRTFMDSCRPDFRLPLLASCSGSPFPRQEHCARRQRFYFPFSFSASVLVSVLSAARGLLRLSEPVRARSSCCFSLCFDSVARHRIRSCAVCSPAGFSARGAPSALLVWSEDRCRRSSSVFVFHRRRRSEFGSPLRLCRSQFCDDYHMWKLVVFLSRRIKGSNFLDFHRAFTVVSLVTSASCLVKYV